MKKISSSKTSVIGEVIGILIGIFFLVYLFPRLPFVTSEYTLWLPVGLAATILAGVLKICVHFFQFVPLSRIFRILAHIIEFYSVYVLRTVFPFDFSLVGMPALNSTLRFALLIANFAIIIAIIVETVKTILLVPLDERKLKQA